MPVCTSMNVQIVTRCYGLSQVIAVFFAHMEPLPVHQGRLNLTVAVNVIFMILQIISDGMKRELTSRFLTCS
ncbi:MAG: hypothetical protein NMNS02_06570 [Nitrosomonas sp.]|nr:MAG: hypothetical protein NMNS02_06570 [Nitrosomonas sp.]